MKHVEPPRIFLRFLRWYCRRQLVDSIEGDLIEEYNNRLHESGKTKADVMFIIDVFSLFRPGIMKKLEGIGNLNTNGIYQSYFKIAWRNVVKNRNYSAISILGLTISITLGILIFHHVIFELRFDRFFDDANRIYRINSTLYEGNRIANESAETDNQIASALKEKLPYIENAGRLISTRSWFECTLSNGQSIFNEHSLYYADPGLLSIFSLTWIAGDKSALDKPFSAVLSASVARRYFGDDNPLGKVLHLRGSFEDNDYTVTGIIENLGPDTHLDFTVLLSNASLENNIYYKNFTAYTYVKVIPKADIKTMQDNFPAFVSNYIPELNPDKSRIELNAQPITDIHLHASLSDEIKSGGDVLTIYSLLSVAGLILVIAWINQINLVTARSATRIREAGIRKISGASRMQVISQLLIESLIVNGSSIIIAILIACVVSEPFFMLTGLSHSTGVPSATEFLMIGSLLLLFLFIGAAIAGWYPALTISSISPAQVVKGKILVNRGGFSLRRALIVFQFTCAIGLTSAILVFNEQFRFLESRDIGVDIHKTLIVRAPTVIESSYKDQLSSFKTYLQSQSIISSVTNSSAVPGENIGWIGQIRKDTSETSPKWNFLINIVDTDFIDSYNLRLMAGRNFSEMDYPSGKFGSKIESVIINVKGLSILGFSNANEAIDNFIYWGNNRCRIVGVVADFHQLSPKDAIAPVLLSAGGGPNLTVKLERNDSQENIFVSVAAIEEAWGKFFPGNPFDYFFLDSFYAGQYSNDKNIINLFHIYCGFAILISCLGLFGLASFTVQQRTKEIGIRKILGASVGGILVLLSKEFIKPIAIAAIIATAISYVALDQWLQIFATRIDIGREVFLASGAAVILMASISISYKSRRAATANPVDSLRTE